jgi:toxin ParE1/3/4
MRVVFRPEARAEALEAQAWYELRSPGLGLEFARALDAALASALRDPAAFIKVEGECRRVILRKFPYSLVYRAEAGVFLVAAIFHHRRNPRLLIARVGA